MTARIQVDPANGSVKLSDLGLVVGRGLAQSRAETMLAAFHKGTLDHGNGYSWLNFHGLTLEGMPCGLALGFHKGTLTEVHLGVALPDVKLESGWPTREALDEEIAFMRKTFHSQLGRDFGDQPETFKWGVAWSGFDPKGFTATTGIRYA